MPEITIHGARLWVEERGAGPEPILFLHGLLWSGAMFEPQMRALAPRHRCVALDFRGQGRSEVTAAGYGMDALFEDVTAVIERLGLAPCHVVGLSMGGFVAMRLATRRPELVRSLVLLETSADPEPRWNVPRYRLLALIGRRIGLGLVKRPTMKIMFGPDFLADPARAALRREWEERLLAINPVGLSRALEGVIARDGMAEELSRVKVPTLVIVGERDTATPLERARRIQARIAGAELVVIPRAGHTSTVEEPEAVTAAIAAFLEKRRG
jgi:pimeloyl-ACP methyl ester carboxylesterase